MEQPADSLCVAIELASKAHYLTKDKQGKPYIFHPLRVMMQFDDEDAQIVAVLHDVIEDSEFKLADLEEMGFSETIIDAIDAITNRKDRSYADYLVKVKQNPLALRVKLADIHDNVSRLTNLRQSDPETATRLEAKYMKAISFLTEE